MRAIGHTLSKQVCIKAKLLRHICQAALGVRKRALSFIQDTLVFKVFSLILSAPGGFGSQPCFGVSQVERVNNVFYFSGLYVVCIQQSKCVEIKVSTMRSSKV